MCAGGTSRKSTWTSAVAVGDGQAAPVDSTTCSDIVVPGAPAPNVTAAVPWPDWRVPPVSVHAQLAPGSSGTDAGTPDEATGVQFTTVIVGIGGAASTIVSTEAVLFEPLMSVTAEPTVAEFVAAPAT